MGGGGGPHIYRQLSYTVISQLLNLKTAIGLYQMIFFSYKGFSRDMHYMTVY